MDLTSRHGSFHSLLEHLLGETVRIQTNDSAFSGKLAGVETTFVTLAAGDCDRHHHHHHHSPCEDAEERGKDGGSDESRHGSSTDVVLVYIPVRKINAVVNL